MVFVYVFIVTGYLRHLVVYTFDNVNFFFFVQHLGTYECFTDPTQNTRKHQTLPWVGCLPVGLMTEETFPRIRM